MVYPPICSRLRQGDDHPAYGLLWSMAHLSYLPDPPRTARLGVPTLAIGRYCQHYSLGGSSDAVSAYCSVVATCWHYPHSMRSRIYVTVRCPSVCLSIRLSVRPFVCPSVYQHYSLGDSSDAASGYQSTVAAYWHYPQDLCKGTVSVRLSVPAWAHSSKPSVTGLLLPGAQQQRAVPRCQRT